MKRAIAIAGLLACLGCTASAQLSTTHAGPGAPGGGGGGGGPIAFVNSGDISNNGGSGTLSNSYSISTGTNEGLVVCITGGTIGTDADDITSVTYNSVSATLLAKYTNGGVSPYAGARYQYAYYLPLGNTSAGSYIVSISSTTNHFLLSVVGEYSRIQQGTTPDGTGTHASNGASDTVALTTATSGDWVVVCSQPSSSPGVNSPYVQRLSTASYYNPTLLDSTGTVAPGSQSITATGGGGAGLLDVAVGLSPG